MPRPAKSNSAPRDSTANLGFEAKLWLAADKLRNNMDAAEYKHVVLGLIGDCAARLEPERSLIHRYGKRVADAELMAMASHQASVENVLPENQYLGRHVYAVFPAAEILADKGGRLSALRDSWLASEDMQFMAARSRAGSFDGLYVAAWGAHNAQSHNHNDVGNPYTGLDYRHEPALVTIEMPSGWSFTLGEPATTWWLLEVER